MRSTNFIQFLVKPSSTGLLLIGWFLVRLWFAHLDIDPQATKVLQRWISAEYVRYQTSREDISLEDKAMLLKSAENISFISIEARGKPERMIFRVEIAPNPAQPPHSATVRYFRMQHSLISGWITSLPYQSDAVMYFIAIFMI